MKSVITLIVDHKKPIANLPELVAQRAYTLPGVDDVEIHAVTTSNDLITLPVIEVPQVDQWANIPERCEHGVRWENRCWVCDKPKEVVR